MHLVPHPTAQESLQAAAHLRARAQFETMIEDGDEAMVAQHRTSAILLSGPDERAAIVRASLLLEAREPITGIVEALARWAHAYPEAVTPPNPWAQALERCQPEPCGVYAFDHLGRGPCNRPAGHRGEHLPAPF